MSTPEDPEELFDQMVPQLSQQLVDRYRQNDRQSFLHINSEEDQ